MDLNFAAIVVTPFSSSAFQGRNSHRDQQGQDDFVAGFEFAAIARSSHRVSEVMFAPKTISSGP